MRTKISKTLFIGMFFVCAIPGAAYADLIQDSADIRSSDGPVSAGGWIQDLGRGLTGTLTGALFPIRIFPVPGGRHPRFEVMLEEFADETYSTHSGPSYGSVTWPAANITLDPPLGIEEYDATLSLAIPEDGLRFTMNPDRAYRVSLGLSTFWSEGAFQVYGSNQDAYANGSTSASGLEDMAFTLRGIEYAPPALEVEAGPAVSNVLFLPGIKGSRLYREDASCDECETMLWEPYSNDAVQDLMLAPSGASLYDDIYVRDEGVIDSVLGSKFYKSFFASLDAAEENDTYGSSWSWKSVAYDWRLSLNDLIQNGVEDDGRIYYGRASSTPYIEQTLRELAAASATGKVTIVAHSNGGLVAKALLRKLGTTEASSLVDDVILVGVPQIGAPQAMGALLYGYGEALPRSSCADSLVIGWLCGMFVDRSTARAFAENAPMGYHLLPSHTYMKFGASDSQPVAKFSAQELYASERERYGNTLGTIDELHDYLLARDGGRIRPEPSDTESPSVLSEPLIAYARSVHETLDSWTPPSPMLLHQIAGWGSPTVSGIEFYEEPRILGLFGSAIPRYRPLFSQDGDGVVPQYSATPLSGGLARRYWLDLPSENESGDGAFSHSNLFELSTVEETVASILTDTALPEAVKRTVPAVQDDRRWRIFMLHSPLSLEAFDDAGAHTGESDTGFDSELPNVTYGEFGEVKYLVLPADAAYTIELKGKRAGSFSLDMQELQGGRVLTSTTLANIPSTSDTVARMDVGLDILSPVLSIDHESDGVPDAVMPAVIGSYSLYEGSQPVLNYEPATQYPSDHTESSKQHHSIPLTEAEPPSTPAADHVSNGSFATTSPFAISTSTEADDVPSVSTSTPSRSDTEVVTHGGSQQYGKLAASAVAGGETILARIWRYVVELIRSLFR